MCVLISTYRFYMKHLYMLPVANMTVVQNFMVLWVKCNIESVLVKSM